MSDKPENAVVFTVQTPITQFELQNVINLLNKKELGPDNALDEDEVEPLLTIEEVMGNPELLAYICNQMVEQDDIFEIWNDDGFSDFKDFRK